jgi:hypothetical protein
VHLDISPPPEGRTENSPGPKAFGPGNHTHNGIALKGRANRQRIDMLLLYSTPQSLSHLIVHAVFSTKDRWPFLHSEEIRIETCAYHRKFSYQEQLR